MLHKKTVQRDNSSSSGSGILGTTNTKLNSADSTRTSKNKNTNQAKENIVKVSVIVK